MKIEEYNAIRAKYRAQVDRFKANEEARKEQWKRIQEARKLQNVEYPPVVIKRRAYAFLTPHEKAARKAETIELRKQTRAEKKRKAQQENVKANLKKGKLFRLAVKNHLGHEPDPQELLWAAMVKNKK